MPPCRCAHSLLVPLPGIAEAEDSEPMHTWRGTFMYCSGRGELTNAISPKEREAPRGGCTKVCNAHSAQ